MRGTEERALSELRQASNNDIVMEAAKLAVGDYSQSTRKRCRRLLAEARRRELPIALMDEAEQIDIQNRAQADKAYSQQVQISNNILIQQHNETLRQNRQVNAAMHPNHATSRWDSRNY